MLYTNDFLEEMNSCAMKWEAESFADDTVVFAIGSTKAEAAERLNEGLARATSWYGENFLVLNVAKTKVVVFCKRPASHLLERNERNDKYQWRSLGIS